MRRYPLPSAGDKYEAVILADGDYPAQGSIAAAILSQAQCVVCCDGAADAFIASGGTPAAIVGDCDSLSENTARLFADRIYRSPDQQTNDLTKAFRFCMAQGKIDIAIVGATGKREDHTMANISLLAEYCHEIEAANRCCDTEEANYSRETETSGGCVGAIVAVAEVHETESAGTVGKAAVTANRIRAGEIKNASPNVVMVTDYGVFNAVTEDSLFASFAGQQVSIFTIATDTPVAVEGLLYTPPAAGLSGWWRGSLNEAAGSEFSIFTSGPTIIFRNFGR